MAFYAYTRALDPASGDVLLSGATWAGGSPAAELVQRCLRTRLRSYLPDPTFGLDYDALQSATPNAGETARKAILAALARFTRAPARIENLTVAVTVSGAALLYDVSFDDPRVPSPRRRRVTGSV